jgi:ABC-type nickel/cobalt efflux system permease component RcnA
MFRNQLFCLLSLVSVLFGAAATPAHAHPSDEAAVFHYLWVQPRPGEISVQHATIVGGLLTQAAWPELDRDGNLELSEKEQEEHARHLAGGLALLVDGKRVPLSLQAYEYPSHTEFFGTSFATIKLLLTAPLGPVKAAGRKVELRDDTFPHYKGSFPNPELRPTGMAAGVTDVSEDGRRVRLRLAPEGTLLPKPAASPGASEETAPSGKPRLPGLELSPGPGTAPTGDAALPRLDANKLFPKPEAFVVSTDDGHGGETAGLKNFLNRPLSPGLIAIALAAAIMAGMAHALSPGHGKAMVAAYLVGSRGTVRDAIILGIVVTITHTLGVYILGAVTLWLTTTFQTERVGQWLEFVSGALVLGMGFWLFQRGLLAYHGLRELPGHSHGPGGHSHGHDHSHSHAAGHAHAHSHDAPGKSGKDGGGSKRQPPSDSPLDDRDAPEAGTSHARPDRWSLIGLGVAGGMVPCFDALAILIAAVNLASGRPPQEKVQYIAAGMGLIAAFSLGMALVLVAIGILMVKAKDLMARFTGESRAMKALPAVSGAVLFFLGAWLTLQALVHAGVLRIG